MATTIPIWVPPQTPADTLNGQRTANETQETVAAAGSVIPVIYGEQWVGGRIFACDYTSGTWTVGALFCLGEIDSFVTLHLDGAAPVSGVLVDYYTGTTSQTANAKLAAAIAGYADTLVVSSPNGNIGVAYVVVQFTDAHYKNWPSITARIKGRKVYSVSENWLRSSEQLDLTSYWTRSQLTTVSANAGVAPDGTTTADRIVPNATSSVSHYITGTSQTSVSLGQRVTASIYVKRDTGPRYFRILTQTAYFAKASMYFDLDTGSVSNPASTRAESAGMRDVGNGWWRIWAVYVCTTSASAPTFSFAPMNTASATAWTGDTVSGPLVWGAQLEVSGALGVYSATTTTATAPAWSDNPALCLRDLIRNRQFGAGEDTDDLAFLTVANECDALVSIEKRRLLGITLDSARSISEWINTLATYAGAWVWKRGDVWTTKADRPALLYTFDSDTESFTGQFATLTQSGGVLVVTGTATDMAIYRASIILNGAQNYTIRARIRRTAGSSGWDGNAYWVTSRHSTDTYHRATAADPAVANNTWTVVEWTLTTATGGGEVSDVLITQIRLDLWNGAASEVWEVDWISIGIRKIDGSNIVAGSVKTSVADSAQVPTVMVASYTDTSVSPWRTRDASPVSLSGVATGAVEWRESAISLPGVTRYSQAIREANERLLKLQHNAQVEFTMFDEGMALEPGDVVSLIHTFAGTGSAAENDSSTLFRVIGVRSSAPGRFTATAVGYSATDYDNTEASVTWGASPAVVGRAAGAVIGVNFYDSAGNPLSDAAVLNSSQLWSDVTGGGKPADNATANTLGSGLFSARPAGADGDFYYATDTGILYQKISGVWISSSTANVVGSGLLASRPTGVNGDFYYATDTLTLYQKVAGSWVAGPTYGATWGNDASNITGLGGDGINIVQPRFAGAWGRSDPDGKLPVFQQNGISACGVYSSDGVSGPTAGYYGLTALKVATLSTGTRRVYFATAINDYNIAIPAGCKWLVQAKVWSTIAGDAKVGLRDNVSNTYRAVTRTIAAGEVQAWQSLAGVVDMSTGTGSTATAANIALEFLAGPGYCWFDALMIEKQVGPSTTPSPWRMPPTSQAYGSLVSATAVAPGTLQAGMALDQGDGTSRQLLSGLLQGTCKDGDAITFSPAFSDIPTVTFSPGAFTAVTGLTAPYSIKCEAKSLTASGFTASIRAVEQSGTQTLVTDTGGATGATYDYEMDKSTSTQAYDDKYIFTFNITIKNGEPEYGIYSPGNAKVNLYVALSSGVWTKVGNITVFGTAGASATTAVTGVVATSNVIDGLGQHAGKEFAIDRGADLYGGSVITAFSSVKYYTATAPTEVSATSATSAGVPYTVIGTVAGT